MELVTTQDELFDEDELDSFQKALRDQFVEEYLKDFNALNACLRVGFEIQHAQNYSQTFLEDTYVQRRLREQFYTHQKGMTEEQVIEQDKQLILNSLRQAAQHGPYTSRVAACAKLASIHGLDKGDAKDGEDLADLLRDFAENAPD